MADDPKKIEDVIRAPHVRTFAKDVEALTGKKPVNMMPEVAPAPKKEEVLPPKPLLPPAPLKEEPPLPAPEVQEDLLARLKEKANEPKIVPLEAPIPLTEKPPAPPKAAPIHTYKSDFADRIDDKNASVFSVLAAEKDAARKETVKLDTSNRKNLRLYVIGGMLILLGIVGIYAAVRWANHLSFVPTEEAVPSLVFADSRKELSGTGRDLLTALADAAAEPLPQGNVLVTYVTTSTTTENGLIKFPEPGGALIRALELPAPNILLRNIADESTVGVIHAGEDTRTFFILRVLSYERTFAGMLEWEATMRTDLDLLYPEYVDAVPMPVATTTATTTAPVEIPLPRFVDDVVASRDVRVLKDYRDRTVLIYGYRDKETLIISRDEEAFSRLVERVTATDTR